MARFLLRILAAWLIALSIISCSPSSDTRPEWSIIVYTGTDEEELAVSYDPRFRQILAAQLPPNVELITEQDTYRPDGTFRTIKRGRFDISEFSLPEHDSAAPASLADFLRWANQNARGEKRIFLVITHSWGWRGIVQDYTIPGKPDTDTMMPLREMARVMQEEKFRPDVMWLDACILGNVEPVEEFKNAAPYLILSQREMPYSGFPVDRLFGILGKPGLSPREFVRVLPEEYVKAYSRNGSLLTSEGEFPVVSVAGIDTGAWSALTGDFRRLAQALDGTDFKARLAADSRWVDGLADKTDQNSDLLEFLTRLPSYVNDPDVAAIAAKIRADVGYPVDVDALSHEAVSLDPAQAARFELRIEADGLLPEAKALKEIKAQWLEANQDQFIPDTLRYAVVRVPGASGNDREFIVSGEVTRPLQFRPWLAGTQYYILTTEDASGVRTQVTRTREKDYFAVDRFPQTSFLVAEAHTQGLPFIHGIGIMLYPRMSDKMNRSEDPITHSTGQDFYRETAWHRGTGWGDAMFLAPAAGI
jgi:hypothetical protein